MEERTPGGNGRFADRQSDRELPSRPVQAMRFLVWVWLGLVVGVSFVATPIKFTAESLTRPVALDVGRATFHLLNRIEIALVVILLALIWWSLGAAATTASGRRVDPILALAAIVVSIVALQAFWLLPQLDERVATIIAGSEPPPSILHTVFGVFEVIKVIALGVFGHRVGRDRIADRGNAAASTEPSSLVTSTGTGWGTPHV